MNMIIIVKHSPVYNSLGLCRERIIIIIFYIYINLKRYYHAIMKSGWHAFTAVAMNNRIVICNRNC